LSDFSVRTSPFVEIPSGPDGQTRVVGNYVEISSNMEALLREVLHRQDKHEEILDGLRNEVIMGSRSPESSAHEEDPQVTRRASNRSSMLHKPQDFLENSILRVQTEIPEDLKMTKLTYRAVIRAEKNMASWCASKSDPTKKIQDFFTAGVLQQLIANEQREGRPCSEYLTVSSIHEAKPATILDMVARFLRPVTPMEFHQAVFNTVSEPIPTSKDWMFGIDGYDRQLHGPISKCLEQIKALEALMTLNASREEVALWPTSDWGSKSRPGMLRVFSKTLGKWEEHFTEKIGEPTLKAMKTTSEFFEALAKVNHELATIARQLTARKSQYNKPPRLEDSYQLSQSGARDQRAQTSFLAGKPYNQTHSGTPLVHARPNNDTRERRHEYQSNSNQTNSNNASRREPYNRLRELEAELRSPDDTDSLARVHPVDDAGDSENEEYFHALCQVQGSPVPRPVGKLFNGDVKPRPPASSMPCFAESKGDCQRGKDCPYSHDPLVYKEVCRKQVENIIATLGKAWLQMTVDKMDNKGYQQAPRYSDAPVRSVTSTYSERPASPQLPPSTPATPAQIWPMHTRHYGADTKTEGTTLSEWKENS
jgi:hypothetical protein